MLLQHSTIIETTGGLNQVVLVEKSPGNPALLVNNLV